METSEYPGIGSLSGRAEGVPGDWLTPVTVRFVPFRDTARIQPDVSCESVALPLLYVHCPARTDNAGKQTSTARTILHVFMSTFVGFIMREGSKESSAIPVIRLQFFHAVSNHHCGSTSPKARTRQSPDKFSLGDLDPPHR